MDALLRRLARAGLRRGLAGEHWAWLLIAGAAYVLRRARRPSERMARIRLRANDRYLVTLQPGGGSRRAPARGGHAETDGASGGPEDAYQPGPTTG
jgi:hypothetical protein